MKDELIPLRDILKEIEFLHSLRETHDFDSFKESSTDVRACSYSVLVISEAVRRIPEEWLEEHPETPWHAIRAIGNKLRHEYQRISEVILWGIATNHSDSLKSVVEVLLEEHTPTDS